jgi:hypothetical protein
MFRDIRLGAGARALLAWASHTIHAVCGGTLT